MNVLYLSPAFPPTTPAFCHALAAEGATVLGIGDEPIPAGSPVREALRHYVHEPRMGEYEALRGAARALMSEHGPFARIESNGEHWLALEARLREELGVAGMDSATLARRRSKLGMSGLFAEAGIAYPPTIPASDASAVRALARGHGLPLVFKPETGSGAENTFRVRTDGALEEALDRQPYGHVVQPFIDAPIVTYDGLVDRDGRVVFATSHVYDQGIMQIRERDGDGHYYSLRELPPGLEELGQRAVAAFEVRERFFHLECFAHGDGRYTALEMNLRPPGGFTTEMMNAACDIDVYALWARILVGRDVRDFRYGRRYHTAHAGRRAGRHYRLSTEHLLTELNGSFLAEHGVPPAFAVTMGDAAYLLRHPRLEELKRAIALVQELA